MNTHQRLLRGPLFTCLGDPGEEATPLPDTPRYLQDGAIWFSACRFLQY